MATVRRRVDEDHVSVAIPSYNFPHSIRESSKVKRGQQIELTGEVTRIDDETVTIALGPLVTVDIGVVRLVEKYSAPKRRTLLRDKVD
ncbi:hypothetical protein [Mesorhizobium sp.]|uniref:hypothetical protein n=1 Tax=Mesorhizobium sp. TaxID=1871066 RepID=UPI00345D1807